MFIISKTIKGKEFVYSKAFMIACNSEAQAKALSKHLNENNENTLGTFKLKDNETWFVYEVDKYDNEPRYKVKTTKNKISLVEYY